ncbi:TATA box-binding protein-associated factor RNA polymerase I subunit A [Garra rufa]|uniref:TATA box-binding protein-associated factor RNA polymerase I subunit A n=1 Tax=Garra rufa TaxID=137080 RepID=UPI003CCE8647
MDDIEDELNVAARSESPKESVRDHESIKLAHLLHQSHQGTKGGFTTTDFIKCNRKCLNLMREAMLQHNWQEAVVYFHSYIQTLEAKTYNDVESSASEIIWRIGTQILHHHPNSSPDDFNSLYEQLKNLGVNNYSKMCLEHCFHLLLNGQMEEAKRQLSIADSWRYGKRSIAQAELKGLIRAYCSYLDYLVWKKKSSAPESGEMSSNHEMHSYFRQASVSMKEIVSRPGVWDPFVLGYCHMLEFYEDEETALQVLENYAYNKEFPTNPNAHVYLYEFLKRHEAPQAKLISSLKILHSLVPSHELMLELCSLLLQTEQKSDLEEALVISMDLLEFSSWKCDLKAWNCCLNIMKKLRNIRHRSFVKKQWDERGSLWLSLHYRSYIARKDAAENVPLLLVKKKVLMFTRKYTREYYRIALKVENEACGEKLTSRNPKKKYKRKRLDD